MKCNPLLNEALELLGKDRITTTDFEMSAAAEKSLRLRLDKGAATGDYSSLYRMNPETKQEIVNHIFNKRSGDVKGLTPHQSQNDVNYFGSTVKMKPLEFLKVVLRRPEGLSNKEYRKDFAHTIAKSLSKGKDGIKLAPPKLWLDIQGDRIVVTGHEGRHRSDAMFEIFGKDVKLPVDVEFRNNGGEFRARNLTEEIFDKKITTEEGVKTNYSLRDLLGTAGVMALLGLGAEDEM